MADGTKIEWTDATLNVVNGCDVVSPGCTNCYAMRSGGRNLPHHPATGLTKATKAGHVWTGEVRFNETALLQPLRWRRPRKIFWNAHGDLFHPKVPDEWIDRCFAVMALTSHHIHQVLTKRPERMREYLTTTDFPDGEEGGFVLDRAHWLQSVCEQLGGDGMAMARWPLPNVWLGVSVEDQQRADERIPDLIATPAAIRWLSCEPLLGPVDLCRVRGNLAPIASYIPGCSTDHKPVGIDWVVAGGESGPSARPMHPDWARSLRDQCAAAGIPFHFKQWGAWGPVIDDDDVRHVRQWVFPPNTDMLAPGEPRDFGGCMMHKCGKAAAGRRLDGQLHDGFPCPDPGRGAA